MTFLIIGTVMTAASNGTILNTAASLLGLFLTTGTVMTAASTGTILTTATSLLGLF